MTPKAKTEMYWRFAVLVIIICDVAAITVPSDKLAYRLSVVAAVLSGAVVQRYGAMLLKLFTRSHKLALGYSVSTGADIKTSTTWPSYSPSPPVTLYPECELNFHRPQWARPNLRADVLRRLDEGKKCTCPHPKFPTRDAAQTPTAHAQKCSDFIDDLILTDDERWARVKKHIDDLEKV